MDQQKYEDLRLRLIDKNEADVHNIYLDIYGLPTAGLGVAFNTVWRDKQRVPHVVYNEKHTKDLINVLKLSPEDAQKLETMMKTTAQEINDATPGRDRLHYRNLKAFEASPLGKAEKATVGPLVSTKHTSPSGVSYSWDMLTSPTSPMQIKLTKEQSLELFKRVAPEFETDIPRILKNVNCPTEALSEEQRAAMFSMSYQGHPDKAQAAAKEIGRYWRGEINEQGLHQELRRAVYDPAFPTRSNNELEYMDHIKPSPHQQKHSSLDSMQFQPRDTALQAAFRKHLPNVSDEKIAEVAYAARVGGISRPDHLGKVAVIDNAIYASCHFDPGARCKVDLTTPAPPLEETKQATQALDQQQAQQLAQWQQQDQVNQQAQSMMARTV